jgi:transcriptional regulator with XRE-family HTH domain
MAASNFESLAEYMAAEKVSDEALARRLEVSRPHVTRLRLRKKRPSLQLATKLEQITGIPASKFAEALGPGA